MWGLHFIKNEIRIPDPYSTTSIMKSIRPGFFRFSSGIENKLIDTSLVSRTPLEKLSFLKLPGFSPRGSFGGPYLEDHPI